MMNRVSKDTIESITEVVLCISRILYKIGMVVKNYAPLDEKGIAADIKDTLNKLNN